MEYLEDKINMGGIMILLAFELFLTIPLMTDSMVKEGSVIIVLVSVGHFFMWLFGKTGMVQNPLGFPHIFGMVGVMISIIPLIGFVWHGLISFILIKYVLNFWKDEQEKKKKVRVDRKWEDEWLE